MNSHHNTNMTPIMHNPPVTIEQLEQAAIAWLRQPCPTKPGFAPEPQYHLNQIVCFMMTLFRFNDIDKSLDAAGINFDSTRSFLQQYCELPSLDAIPQTAKKIFHVLASLFPRETSRGLDISICKLYLFCPHLKDETLDQLINIYVADNLQAISFGLSAIYLRYCSLALGETSVSLPEISLSPEFFYQFLSEFYQNPYQWPQASPQYREKFFVSFCQSLTLSPEKNFYSSSFLKLYWALERGWQKNNLLASSGDKPNLIVPIAPPVSNIATHNYQQDAIQPQLPPAKNKRPRSKRKNRTKKRKKTNNTTPPPPRTNDETNASLFSNVSPTFNNQDSYLSPLATYSFLANENSANNQNQPFCYDLPQTNNDVSVAFPPNIDNAHLQKSDENVASWLADDSSYPFQDRMFTPPSSPSLINEDGSFLLNNKDLTIHL